MGLLAREKASHSEDSQTEVEVKVKTNKNQRPYHFLATLVALHLTPVSQSLGRSFGLA